MPPKAKKPETACKNEEPEEDSGSNHDGEESPFNFDEVVDKQPKKPTSGSKKASAKKRPFDEEDVADDAGGSGDIGGEVSKMFSSFGSNMSRAIEEKRKRLEQLTASTSKATGKRVEESYKAQALERANLEEEFNKSVGGMLTQWDADVEKLKESEEKMEQLFKQQQKLFTQTRVVQVQRLKTIRNLHEQYEKSVKALETAHSEQQTAVQADIRREHQALQKKLGAENQKHEMGKMQQNLQQMLFQ